MATSELVHEKYRELAVASIVQGINDWLESKYDTEQDLYRWLENCSWFDLLELDREYFYVKILKLKEKGVKKITMGERYGKKNDL